MWYGMCVFCLTSVLVYLVLHVKDMSLDKKDASDVTDQQRKTRNRLVHDYIILLCFVIILGFCYQKRHCYKTNKYTSLVQGT